MRNTKMKNPTLYSDIFVPDVEAHVWNDGRIYLYGSFDIQGRKGYCSNRHHVYSSNDMVNWQDHGICFTTEQIDWHYTKTLYAPDCAYRNGMYYLYYDIPSGDCGVAKSPSPTGPFEDVGKIDGIEGIDPAVFIDDDGQAYIYWGQFDKVRVAKLKENMVEIEKDTVTQPLSVREHEFHEASSVKKINGKYYYLFCDTHRHGGKATCLGYAVSDNPMQGFEYKGVIIDNFGCDPEVWNNHGSIECFNGQWYIFYHRSTHGSKFSRHLCIEPITINPDGTIDEVIMTSSCGKNPLPANEILEANRACMLSGNVRIAVEESSWHHLALCKINPGDTATFRYLKFDGETSVSARLKTDGEFFVDMFLDDALCGTISSEKTDGYTIVSSDVKPIQGDFTLTLKFRGDFTDATFDELVFKK